MRAVLCWCLVAALPLLVPACGPAEEPAGPAAEPAAAGAEASEKEVLRELVRRWDEGLNARDAEAVLALYADDGVMMAPYEPAREGKEAIRAWLEGLFVEGEVDVRNRPGRLQVAGGWAFGHGTYILAVGPEGEGQPHAEEGKWSGLFRRDPDGSWRVVRNIWNTDSPPPGSSPPPGAAAATAATGEAAEAAGCVGELAALDGAFVDAFEAGDAVAVAGLHTARGMRLPPGMAAVSSRPAVAAYTQAYVDLFDPRDLRLDQQGQQESGRWGATWGTFAIDYAARDGSGSLTGAGKYLAVSRRDDEGCWRFAWVLWNSDVPPPEM